VPVRAVPAPVEAGDIPSVDHAAATLSEARLAVIVRPLCVALVTPPGAEHRVRVEEVMRFQRSTAPGAHMFGSQGDSGRLAQQ
jgi:hypothetical protein